MINKLLVILPLLLWQPLAGAVEGNLEDELLPSEQAFVVRAIAKDESTIQLTWNIAKGTYLYRDKFQFRTDTAGLVLGDPVIPPGKIKKDEFFGDVEIYRSSVSIDLPVTRSADLSRANLILTSQGCADIGVCYPPLIRNVTVTLPAASAPAGAPGPLDKLTRLGDELGLSTQQDQFLPPDQAFVFEAGVVDEDTLKASWTIADAYYLYRDKISFRLEADGMRLGNVSLPPGKVKEDPFLGRQEVYYQSVEVLLPLIRSHGKAVEVKLTAAYQGCADAGLCYPPATKTVKLSVPPGPVAGTAADTTPSASGGKEKTFFQLILIAFGSGLLLTFTPCVLPMIPILSSQIVGEGGEHVSKVRGGMLSLSYVMGTAVTYTAAGILAGAAGEQLQAYFQNVWAIGVLSGLLAIMSLSMFGLFELQVPSFIQSRVQHHSLTLRGGPFIRTFIMGMLSSLIVGACVSPGLISLLGLAIKQGDPVLGGAIMFSLAMGMGVILVAIGVGAGFILPRAGSWMDSVKHVFGVLLLGVAVYLLSFLPQVPVLLLWAALLIIIGVYMGATQTIPEGSSGWRYLWKGAGTFLIIWGGLALIGGLYGNRDVLQPLPELNLAATQTSVAVSRPGPVTESGKGLFVKVASNSELDKYLEDARAKGKPVLIDFYASWCTDCLRMERGTFSDPRVQEQMLKRFVAIKIDVTDPLEPQGKAIKQRFGIYGPPAMLFFDASGKRRTDLPPYGYRTADEFLAILEQV